jgi:UPF0755 protein
MHFSRIGRLAALVLAALAIGALGLYRWSEMPLTWAHSPAEYTVSPGRSVRQIANDVAQTGAPLNPLLFDLFVRLEGKAAHLQAGTYSIASGITPALLIGKMEKGDVVPIEIVIPEGWTFRQMQGALVTDPDLKPTTKGWTDAQLLEALGATESSPEGLFAPDTYRFARGTTDLEIFRRAYHVQHKRLADAWSERTADLPLSNPYQALVLASIVEKETGRSEDRPQIAAVFLNRLRRGMLLQTDPTVIYGLGTSFDGNLHKRDLMTDTPFNTYTRPGLPPTPISLPGSAALLAVVKPSASDALYFVARGDGTSQFSGNIDEHNRAVSKYQKGGHR